MSGDYSILANYTSEDLRVAHEFLSTWTPFLSSGLCETCTSTLTHRIRSLRSEVDRDSYSLSIKEPSFSIRSPDKTEWNEIKVKHENCYTNSSGSGKGTVDINDTADTNSLGSWKGAVDTNDTADTNSLGSWKGAADMNDTAETNSLGSWGDGTNNGLEHITEASVNSKIQSTGAPEKMSWADMAQEDQQLEGDEGSEVSWNLGDEYARSGEDSDVVSSRQKSKLSRNQWEFIRYNNVRRKKDFICFERFQGKLVNILQGLELHTGVFSAVEQKRIVDFVYTLQEMGQKGELKDRTFTAPAKWMKGKGRVTIQFGCCYNYALDKDGNPPGILQSGNVDPIPHLLKVMIRRLVAWHVLPPSCVPDSCIVNIYDKGDCIPPHIDNHDFVRPFCTVSFLSECNILFGSKLSVLAPGEFSGPIAIPLPVGSVLVLNGNGADVAKHCVPAVPTKRISITFRKMDQSKIPHDFVPDPDLQGLEPLSYETKGPNTPVQQRPVVPKHDSSPVFGTVSYGTGTSDRGILSRPTYHPVRRETRGENYRGISSSLFGRGRSYSEPHSSSRFPLGPPNRRKARVNLNDR